MKTYQAVCDVHRYGNIAFLSRYLDFMTFTGPGMYLFPNATYLITVEGPCENPWKKDGWSVDTNFCLQIFDCPFDQTIFSIICTAPTRLDAR